MDPTLIVSLITILANSIVAALGGSGVFSPNLQKLISTLIASAASLFQAFKSGISNSALVTDVITNLQNDLNALEADTSVDPTVIEQIKESIRLLQAAIQGYESAQQTTDPSTLTPLPEV